MRKGGAFDGRCGPALAEARRHGMAPGIVRVQLSEIWLYNQECTVSILRNKTFTHTHVTERLTNQMSGVEAMGTDLGCICRAWRERELGVEHDFRSLLRASVHWGNNERARLHHLTPKVVPQRLSTVQPAVGRT